MYSHSDCRGEMVCNDGVRLCLYFSGLYNNRYRISLSCSFPGAAVKTNPVEMDLNRAYLWSL